ncbi:MAG: DUF3536 domain-containing protein [Brevinema sp.]
MKNYFILHGHFYQPPRENPWTGFIDRQISAAPYTDWNVRIHQECYSSCGYAPVMSGGCVSAIINCYEYLSFNFGPTLLEWMDVYAPDTIRRIIDADRISAARNHGHGNAIAQVYNHMIMPLSSIKDQYTQTIWGLEDFKRRFGRISEGIWLGETAINQTVAEVLVDNGVKFVILSPFQAQSYIENEATIDVEGGRIPTGRAYKLLTKNGPLAVFFYDGPMASGVSFGDLLKDSNNLAGAVRSAFAGQQGDVKLVHTATDGEVYGHHKKFGNMALARFIDQNTRSPHPEFEFTNYGAFLEENPPQLECALIPGNNNLGSSWSCAHGVGRWKEDCSCHTGGLDSWNQKWRAPLRDAFDFLRDAISEAAEKALSPLLTDVWGARNAYFQPYTLKTEESIREFLSTWQKKQLSSNERRQVILMMEGLRFAMLMYTSCGWFFSDISGIETIQDLLYAQRAYECFEPYMDKSIYDKYLSILDQAQSNLTEQGSGKDILLKAIETFKIPPETLRRYLVIQAIESSSPELVIGDLRVNWSLRENSRGMLVFKSFIYNEIVVAYKMKKGRLFYSELSSMPHEIDDDFWASVEWTPLSIASLPFFLRLDVLSRNLSAEITKGHDHNRTDITLAPEAFTGLEKYLLPQEKINLELFLYQKLLILAGKMGETLTPQESSKFHLMITLYRKLNPSNAFLEQIAQVTIGTLHSFLLQALRQRDAEEIKEARLILWEVKDFTPPASLVVLQDDVYRALKINRGLEDGENPFRVQLEALMKDLNIICQ